MRVETSLMMNWLLCHILMPSVERLSDCQFESSGPDLQLMDPNPKVCSSLKCGTNVSQLIAFSWAKNISYYYSARQDSVVPLSKPIIGVDGTEMQEITVPSGTAVFVSILNSNRNPDLWGKGRFHAFRCSVVDLTDMVFQMPPSGNRKDGFRRCQMLLLLHEYLGSIPTCEFLNIFLSLDCYLIYRSSMTFIGGGRSCMYVCKIPESKTVNWLYIYLVALNSPSWRWVGHDSCPCWSLLTMRTEVVISVLVESFKFSPSIKESEIFWQMNGISAPVVGKDKHPQLPIDISLPRQTQAHTGDLCWSLNNK